MGIQIYVVGKCTNQSNKVIGYRILGLNPDGTSETKDVSVPNLMKVLKEQAAEIQNVELYGKELIGKNGSLERYGVVGKDNTLVVLKELCYSDDTTRYVVANSNGRVANIDETNLVEHAKKFGIANGKIVDDHLSAISGHYDILNLPRPYKNNTDNQQSKPQQEKPIQQQKEQTTDQKDQKDQKDLTENKEAQSKNKEDRYNHTKFVYSEIYKDVKSITDPDKLIEEVKKVKNADTTLALKICETYSKSQRLSYKQRAVLERAIVTDRLNDESFVISGTDIELIITNIQDEQDNYLNLANFLKQRREVKFKDGVEQYIKNNAKEYELITKKADEYRPAKLSKDPQTQTQNQNQAQQPASQTNSKYSSKQLQKNDSIVKERELNDSRELSNRIAESSNNLKRISVTNKEKRRNSQTILTDGKFDYAVFKGNQVSIEGFTKTYKPQVDEVLNIDRTVTLDGKEYIISGISNYAFTTEPISEVKMGSNIKDIGRSAFSDCARLITVDISQCLNKMIPAECFFGCGNLEYVHIGKYIERIHEMAFLGCGKLTEVEGGNDCDTIAREAFHGCSKLTKFNKRVVSINDKAFFGCKALSEFNFSTATTIGTEAFKNTGFVELEIPGNVRTIGYKAFADCSFLGKVVIKEGVEEIKEYAFAKTVVANKAGSLNVIRELRAPKSISSVGNDPFRHVDKVYGYTGSVVESSCLATGVDFIALDNINKDNSTNIRIKSTMIDSIKPVEYLYKEITTETEGASNPEYELNNKKLTDIPLVDENIRFLKLTPATEVIEPHIKFKAAVNYLQDVADYFKDPMTNPVLRLKDIFRVKNIPIYNDGCNIISRIQYIVRDTLDTGEFIIVVMNNNLKFICEYNCLTAIEMTDATDNNIKIPCKKYLHVGDLIGELSTISGQNGIIQLEDLTRVNAGNEFLKVIDNNSFRLAETAKDNLLYIPCSDTFLKLHNKQADNLEDEKKLDKTCYSVLSIGDYKDFVKAASKINRNTNANKKFFKELESKTDYEVKKLIKNIASIEEEHRDILYDASIEYIDIVNNSSTKIPNPSLFTPSIWNILTRSYWMVEKDSDWFDKTGGRSLNKISEYTVGRLHIDEFKSNQTVKFSNAYMSGTKGAYIFIVKLNGMIHDIFASRYSLQTIADKLYALTSYDTSKCQPVELMTSAEHFDLVDNKLFYKFFNVLDSKNGWNFEKIAYSNSFMAVEFAISMYKPTGIFYLTATRFARETKVRGGVGRTQSIVYKTIPIFPIGNMDRALLVAGKTNTKAKETELYTELLYLSCYRLAQDSLCRMFPKEVDKAKEINDRYVEARRLIINRDKDITKYEELIDERAIFMLGALHDGQLKTYSNNEAYSEEEEYSIIDDDDFYIDDSEDEDDEEYFYDDEEDDEDDFEIDLDDIDGDEEEPDNEDNELEDDEYEAEYEDDEDFDIDLDAE